MNWKIGETLIVLDEELEGEVVAFNDETVTIQTEEGFDYTYQHHQVYRRVGEKELEFTARKLNWEEEEENNKQEHSKIALSVLSPEIDLHIESLAPNLQFESDFDMLTYQLDAVREVIAQARRKRIRKVVIVHGVGKGVLRAKVRELIDGSFPEIEYLDADYQKFGAGATELIIHSFKEEM